MEAWRLALEKQEMEKRFPSFSLIKLTTGHLAWHGIIITRYGIRHSMTALYLADHPYSAPKVFPDEMLRYGTPHMYKDGSVCTHVPQEWDSNCTVVTAIGWAAAWFHAYDRWCATGEWVGKQD